MPPPLCIGPQGPPVPGPLPEPGFSGGGCLLPPFSPPLGPSAGPFREVEEGEVSQQHGQAGASHESCPPPPHPGQLGDAGTAPGFGVPISCQGLWPVPAAAQRGEGAAPLFRGFLSCSYPLSWRNRNCFVPSGVIFSGTAYILALSQRRVGGPTWDGGRGPRWPGVGTGSRGGRAPAGCTPGVWCHGDRPAQLQEGISPVDAQLSFLGCSAPPR